MDNFTAVTNRPTPGDKMVLSGCSTEYAALRPTCLWRPWIKEQAAGSQKTSFRSTVTSSGCKANEQVSHPVKLFWPRSRCFDYLFQDAEALLRNYPVQATICPYADSSSDEEDDSDMDDEKPTY